MRIVHVNTYDIEGGAAIAAHRLHRGLVRRGDNSKMFVAEKSSDEEEIIELNKSPRQRSKIERIGRHIQRNMLAVREALGLKQRFDDFEDCRRLGAWSFEILSDMKGALRGKLLEQLPDSDILNLHWVADFVDYASFFPYVMKKGISVVWTLHDMNPFTGGCHYDNSCGKYRVGCGACPQLGSELKDDFSRHVWLGKERVFGLIDSQKLRIICPSGWLAEQCKASPIMEKFPVSVIPNGVNADEYAPRERRLSRELLGIPEEAKVLSFVSDKVDNKRKGFHELRGALEKLSELKGIHLVTVGDGRIRAADGVTHLHLGRITHARLLSAVYSCADVHISSSLQDNLPNTVLEAMSCGTPVVGFRVGGLSDIIENGETGYLVEAGNEELLAETIASLLEDDDLRNLMSQKSRALIAKKYSIGNMAARYIELYRQVLGL